MEVMFTTDVFRCVRFNQFYTSSFTTTTISTASTKLRPCNGKVANMLFIPDSKKLSKSGHCRAFYERRGKLGRRAMITFNP